MDPQSVPRGFLRFYVLSLLSRNPEAGYSIMRTIEETTDGAWRPGPGTVYPLLRGMVGESLVKPIDSAGREGSVAYTITEKGKKALEEMQQGLLSAVRRERAMIRMFADLLPANVFAQLFVRRHRDTFEILQQKIPGISPAERESSLKQLRTLLESQLEWIDSQLPPKSRRAR